MDKGSVFIFTIRIKKQASNEPLTLNLIKVRTETGSDISNQKEALIKPEMENCKPIIKNLYKALSESNFQGIDAYLAEIKEYDIPKRRELLQKINDYEYDEAMLLVKEIAVQIGVRIV